MQSLRDLAIEAVADLLPRPLFYRALIACGTLVADGLCKQLEGTHLGLPGDNDAVLDGKFSAHRNSQLDLWRSNAGLAPEWEYQPIAVSNGQARETCALLELKFYAR